MAVRCAARLAVPLFFAGALLAASACQRAPKPVSYGTRDAEQNFTVLPEASNDLALPFLVSDVGKADVRCFEAAKDLKPHRAGEEVEGLVEDNEDAVSEAVIAWLVKQLGIAGREARRAREDWRVTVESPIVLALGPDDLRFAEKADCLDESKLSLRGGLRAVSVAVGAESLRVESEEPIEDDLRKRMEARAKKAGLELVCKAPDVYEPVAGKGGRPKRNDDGERLFKGPKGKIVPESEVPEDVDLLPRSFELRAKKPILFAFRDLDPAAWKRETDPARCGLYLIWNDSKPRSPECDELKAAEFAVSNGGLRRDKATKRKLGKDQLVVRASLDGVEAEEIVTYGKPTLLRLGDRSFVKVTAKTAEEGAQLDIDSLVVAAPTPAPSADDADRDGDRGKPKAPKKAGAKKSQKPGANRGPTVAAKPGPKAKAKAKADEDSAEPPPDTY